MMEDTKISFGDIADEYTGNKAEDNGDRSEEIGNKIVEEVERTFDSLRETTDHDFDAFDNLGFDSGADDIWGV